MPDLVTRLRARQWRLSPQRRVVAEVLVGEHVHLTAEQILGLAGQRLPEISRATVYNTLNELVGMGEVRELTVVDGPKRYDPNVETTHDHLVCESCHSIRDIPATGSASNLIDSDRVGYLITGVDVVYRGLCPACVPEGLSAGQR